MWAFIGVASFVAWIVLSIMWIFSLVKKNGKAKRNFFIGLGCFVLLMVAFSADPGSTNDPTQAEGKVNDVASNEVMTAIDKEAEEKQREEDAIKLAELTKKNEEEARKRAEEKKLAEEAAKKPKLEVLETSAENDGYISYVVGIVQNNTNKDYSYVQVEINLYDKDGVQVGSTLDNMNNLEAGGKWKFKAIILEDDVATYKVKDVTGF